MKYYPKFELLDATYYCLGSTLYNLGRSGKAEMYDAAAAAFETVITKYPDSKYVSQALFNRGECFYHRGKKQEAAETYAQLLAKFPGDKLAVDALYALGVSQEELGQNAEAGKSYASVSGKVPAESAGGGGDRAAGGAVGAGEEIRRSGRPVRLGFGQVAAVETAGRGQPGGRKVLLPGRRLRRRPKTARPRSLAAGGQSLGEAAHWLVRSLLKEGKPAEAAATAEKTAAEVGRWSPGGPADDGPGRRRLRDSRAARRVGGPVCRDCRQYPQAPVAPEALYMAGFAALGKGDYPTALRHAAAFLAAYPHSDSGRRRAYVAAESHLQLGQFADAEKLLRRVVAEVSRPCRRGDVAGPPRVVALPAKEICRNDCLVPAHAGRTARAGRSGRGELSVGRRARWN